MISTFEGMMRSSSLRLLISLTSVLAVAVSCASGDTSQLAQLFNPQG